jgi:hypothetical protein
MNAEQEASRLIAEGAAPDAEYVAAAGCEYGWVKAWRVGDRYVVHYGDHSNAYTEFANDIGDLAWWLELWTLSGLDALVHTANVHGADAVPEAKEGDEGPFYVLETRRWYGATETSSLVMDDTGREPLEFESIDEARAWIDRADSDCPSYKVVTQ